MEYKRGLSSIVSSTLIILVVIISVGMVWFLVIKTTEDTTNQINNDCLTLNLAPLSCTIDSSNPNTSQINLLVQRKTGQGMLSGTRLLLENQQETIAFSQRPVGTLINELSTQNYVLTGSDFNNLEKNINQFISSGQIKFNIAVESQNNVCAISSQPIVCTTIIPSCPGTGSCLTQGVCSQTIPTCNSQNQQWLCNYPSTYGSEFCDNLDNDCDGLVNEGDVCQQLTLNSETTSLIIDDLSGESYLKSISNSIGAINFEQTPLWELKMRDSSGTITILKPSDFPTPIVTPMSNEEGFNIKWSNPSIGDISTTVKVKIVNDATDFQIQVDNNLPTHALFSVDFPKMTIKPINDKTKNILTMPLFTGTLVNPFSSANASLNLKNPGDFSMQWFSLYNIQDNIQGYMQTTDGQGYLKEYNLQTFETGDKLPFKLTNYPEDNILLGNDYNMPYSFQFSVINGNWYDGAKKYRTWALQQPWMSRGKLENSQSVSPILKNAKLFTLQKPEGVQNYNFILDRLLRLKNYFQLGNNELISLWYNWHSNGFDRDLPDHLPPILGVVQSLADVHAANIVAIPYINVGLWKIGSQSYIQNNIAQLAWRDINNNIGVSFSSALNQPVQDHTELDLYVNTARNIVLSNILDIIRLQNQGTEKFDGIYWDFWSGRTPPLDYASNHNHPLGGGNYWSQGKHTMANDVKTNLKQINNNLFFTSESLDETLIDNIEMMYTQSITTFYAGIILLPFWQTVYGDYIFSSDLSTGNPELNNPQINELTKLFYSHLFHSGEMIAINNWDALNRLVIGTQTSSQPTPEQEILLVYLKRLVDSVPQTKKYQRFGERLRPLPQSVDYFLERGTIDYANSPLKILASVWKANNEDIGIIVTNSDTAEAQTTININYPDYELSGQYILYENVAGTRTIINPSINNNFQIPITINAESLKLYELVRSP